MRTTCILAASLATAIAAPAAAQRADLSDSASRAVDRVFDSYRGADRPGCAVGVSRNGVVVLERGYGMANLETDTPISPSSIFHVASVSKQFTAMAVMLLARDGKLSVNDDIRKYLPEIPNYGTTITIRHLLNHTSGLRDQWELLSLARGRFEENRITEADVMDIVPRQKALNFKPGTEYLYSNTGFTLLGVIVKRVSGQSLRDFAAARIFAPLGMTHTHFHDDYTMLVPGRTSAYEPAVRGGWRVSIPNYDTYGATSLFTTTGDLLKWEANFDRPVVGDRGIIDQMQTPTVLTNGDTVAYGFGLVVDRYRGQRRVSHGGADAGYRSWVGRYPDQGLAIALACNTSTVNTTLVAQGVANAFLPAEPASAVQAAIPATVAVADGILRRRVGAWMNPVTKQVTELEMRDGKLSVGHPSGPALTPIGENRFRVAGQPTEIVFYDGARPRFEQTGAAHPIVFERQAPVDAKPGALRAYAGDYYSEELDSRYRVTAGDSTIALRTGTSNSLTARPVFADGFVADGYTIEFTRKGSVVTGFQVTNARMRNVQFTRVPPGR